MGEKVLMSDTGHSKTYYETYDDGTFAIRNYADVEHVLDANKTERNNGSNGWLSKAKEMQAVAEIPVHLAHIWRTQYGVDVRTPEGKVWLKKNILNNSDWQWLRIGGGRV